jgi:hypothetical protein
MRATRAYIASLGTTSLLVASSFLLLAVGSAIVAFNGWPGAGVADDIESVIVDDGPGSRVSGPAQVAIDAAPAAAAVAAAPAPTAPAGGALGAAPGGGGPVARAPLPAPDGGGGGGGGTTGPTGGGGGGPPGGGGGGLVDEVAGRTRGTTDQVGRTVSPVSPELGKTVSDTGKALSDIVSGLPDVSPPKLP